MVVAIVDYSGVKTFIGTDSEVATALAANAIPMGKIMAIYFNGTNTTAMIKTV